MLLYFSIICVTEILMLNYDSHAESVIEITKANASQTTLWSTTTTGTTFNTTTSSPMKRVSTKVKSSKLINKENISHTSPKMIFPTTFNTPNTKAAVEDHKRTEPKTLGLLFPNLRNATGNGGGILGAEGLLPLLLTTLVSNDNIGVIVASLINANRDRVTTPTATNAAIANAPPMPVKNIANNFYGVGAANLPYPYALDGYYPYYSSAYPVYGYDNYYTPYGYYYG